MFISWIDESELPQHFTENHFSILKWMNDTDMFKGSEIMI